MNTSFRKTSIASAIAALSFGIGTTAIAADTVAQDLIEARQESQIWTTFALSPYLRANDLKVSVDNGKATLSGAVEEGVNKDLARQIALGVSGVTSVDNQIVVKPEYVAPTSTERRYGEVIDDATITSSVKSKLVWSKYTDGLKTDVDTNRGNVKLTGTADSEAAKSLASQLTMNTRGVASVDNQLVVVAPKATIVDKTKAATTEAGHDVADGWISTKVKSTLLYSSNVDGSDIKVDTKDGVVTLSGRVDNGAERALAIELAKNVRGVKSVQSKGLKI